MICRYLFIFVLGTLFYDVQSIISPQLLFQLNDDVAKVYQVKAVNKGTQLYVSCRLQDSSIVIRKYLVAGKQYFLKGSYLGPGLALSSNYYDYIFVTSNYLISGSKTTGQMHLWNLTSFSFVSQISSSIYAVKILYSSSLQKICYIQTGTNKLISISTAVLPVLTSNISYYTAHDIQLSPVNNFLALMNDVNSATVTIIKLTNFNLVGRVYGAFTGNKTATWSSDDICLFMTTIRVLSQSIVTFVQMFNTSSFQSTQSHHDDDDGGGSSYIRSSYNYTVTGKSNNIIYLDKSAQLFLPFNSLANGLYVQSVGYPILKRVLQTLTATFEFNLTFTTEVTILYQNSKSYFSVIIDGVFYYFSLYGLCLDAQYLDTNTLLCVDCQTGCALCTHQACIDCQEDYYFDNSTNCVYNQSSLITQSTNLTRNNAVFSFLKSVYFNFILKALNKVPGSRKVLKPIFRFFVNLDDLWLYYYHKRNYCNTTLEMFQSIKDLQNEKWELLQAQKILDKFQVDENTVQSYFTYMDAISKSKDNFEQRQKKNSGYFINSLNFYMTNLALIIATFIILRIIFKILQKYFISVFFREYSFYVFLGIMIMEGNLQYFVYLITNQMQMLSDDIFSHKLSHIYALFTFVSLFSFSCMCFIVLLFAYERKHSKYFFDNTKVNFKGSLYLFSICFLKNIILGFLHSYFNYNYVFKIFLLWSFQFFFLTIYIIILAKHQIQNNTRQWIIIFCGFLRLLIIFSFYLDYKLGINFIQIQSLEQSLFIVYLIIGLISIGYEIIHFIWETFMILKENNFSKKKEILIQNNLQQLNKYKVKHDDINNKFNSRKLERFTGSSLLKTTQKYLVKSYSKQLLQQNKNTRMKQLNKSNFISGVPHQQTVKIRKIRLKRAINKNNLRFQQESKKDQFQIQKI